MQRSVLGAKLHRVRVTHADLDYMGSVTIDRDLLDAADILPHEKVLVVNLENGSRLETYALEGAAGTGVIGMNGGCARKCQVGDRLLLMSFVHLTDREAREHTPRVIFVDDKNQITRTVGVS